MEKEDLKEEIKTSILKRSYRIFLRGLLGILPLTLSIYVVVWIFRTFGGLTDRIISSVIPFFQGVPGIGFLVGGTIIFLLGILFSNKKFVELFSVIQVPFKNMPLIKNVYSAVEDMMFYFSNEEGKGKGKVVLVSLNSEVKIIGLLTAEELNELYNVGLEKDRVAVFIPMSYALGGYTVFVKKSAIEMTNLKVDHAMKSALTAWMKKQTSSEHRA